MIVFCFASAAVVTRASHRKNPQLCFSKVQWKKKLKLDYFSVRYRIFLVAFTKKNEYKKKSCSRYPCHRVQAMTRCDCLVCDSRFSQYTMPASVCVFRAVHTAPANTPANTTTTNHKSPCKQTNFFFCR